MSLSEQEPEFFKALVLASPWLVSDIDIESLNQYPLPCSTDAFRIVSSHLKKLHEQPRWEVYDVPLMWGDMSVAEHSVIRQTPITAQALSYDAEHFDLNDREIDLVLAAAVIHDLGEAVIGDVTYDIKKENKTELDLKEAEVVMQMIDEVEGVNTQSYQRLKELYLRITTSLEEDDILRLLDDSSTSFNKIDWNQLQTLFRLYEKYGYLITALQVFLPLDLEKKSEDLTTSERKIIIEWNREELEAALDHGQDISELARTAILTKNVLLNQWPHIVEASKDKIPSARGFFKNSLTERLVNSANELMKLNLDLSFFQQ